MTPIEARTDAPVYFAIMGPWSTQHTLSANPNFIFRNNCIQYNHDFGSQTPWSGDDKVYYGPIQMGLSIEQRIGNFPEYSAGVPAGGTLYAVLLSNPSTSLNTIDKMEGKSYPNPFTSELTVKVQSNVYSDVCLLDCAGKVIVNRLLDDGQSEVTLSSLEGLTAGIYFLRLTGADKIETIKLTKINQRF